MIPPLIPPPLVFSRGDFIFFAYYFFLSWICFSNPYVGYVVGSGGAKEFSTIFRLVLNLFSKPPDVGYVVGFGGAMELCGILTFFLNLFSKPPDVGYVVGFGGAKDFCVSSRKIRFVGETTRFQYEDKLKKRLI